MLRYTEHNLLARLMALLTIFLVACQSTPPLATPSAPGIAVGITADTCPNVTIQTGQQVVWTNQDKHAHVVRDTPASGSGQFDSGILERGDSFAFIFPDSGLYNYACSADGATTGTVNVQP